MPSAETFTGTAVPAETHYAEMACRPLDAEQCALLVVDVQEKLLPPIWEKDRLVRNVQLLTRLAGILKIPALVTVQYAKGLGNTVPEIASLLPGTSPIDKLTFSCFGSDVFCSSLKRLPGQRTTVLLCGMETHICVMQTALELCAKAIWCTWLPTPSAPEPNSTGASVSTACAPPEPFFRPPR